MTAMDNIASNNSISLREQLNTALKDAQKSRNKLSTATLRLVLAALKDKDIAARSKGNGDGITETEILSMLQTMIKQRNESSKMYRDAGRTELAEQEEQEIIVIKCFLPAQLEGAKLESALDSIIAETGASSIKDMGRLMGAIKGKYAGQVDMGKAGAMLKTKLG